MKRFSWLLVLLLATTASHAALTPAWQSNCQIIGGFNGTDGRDGTCPAFCFNGTDGAVGPPGPPGAASTIPGPPGPPGSGSGTVDLTLTNLTLSDKADPLKTVRFSLANKLPQLSTWHFPPVTGALPSETFVGVNTTQTLTNKNLASPTITGTGSATVNTIVVNDYTVQGANVITGCYLFTYGTLNTNGNTGQVLMDDGDNNTAACHFETICASTGNANCLRGALLVWPNGVSTFIPFTYTTICPTCCVTGSQPIILQPLGTTTVYEGTNACSTPGFGPVTIYYGGTVTKTGGVVGMSAPLVRGTFQNWRTYRLEPSPSATADLYTPVYYTPDHGLACTYATGGCVLVSAIGVQTLTSKTISGGTLTGTIAGSPTFSGSPAFSGSITVSKLASTPATTTTSYKYSTSTSCGTTVDCIQGGNLGTYSAGTTGVCRRNGNDFTGIITIITGSAGTGPNALSIASAYCISNFITVYPGTTTSNRRSVQVTPASLTTTNMGALQPFVSAVTEVSWTLSPGTTVLAASTTYSWWYQVVG